MRGDRIAVRFTAARYVQRGVSAIEYALLAALIAIAVIGALSVTGSANGDIWTRWTTAVITAITP